MYIEGNSTVLETGYKKLSANEELTKTLEFLAKNEHAHLPCQSSVELEHSFGTRGFEMDSRLMDEILMKLKKDGYATDDVNLARGLLYNGIDLTTRKPNEIWFITYEGRIFLQDGGYIEQQKRVRNSHQLRVSERILLALGTGLSGAGAAYLIFSDDVTRNILVAIGCASAGAWITVILLSVMSRR